MRDWLRRTAEADASGQWVPLAEVQDRLLVCNERFKEEKAVSLLSCHQSGDRTTAVLLKKPVPAGNGPVKL